MQREKDKGTQFKNALINKRNLIRNITFSKYVCAYIYFKYYLIAYWFIH